MNSETSGPSAPRRGFDRRSFLKAAGFTLAGSAIAGCERRAVEKAIPFLVKPEEVTPGTATWYASTCGGCPASCGVLIKNRDGRPVKIEGNPAHPLSRGGLCATGQAMVLSLYDSRRLREPRIDGKSVSWTDVDRAAGRALAAETAQGRHIVIVTGAEAGPATLEAIRSFSAVFPRTRHIVYEPLSAAALADAHERCFGKRVVPHYRFDRASVIVSFDADFLGTWISPVEYTAAYRAGRAPDGVSGGPAGASSRMSHHVQIESGMSLTGSNADLRIPADPDEIGELILGLAHFLGAETGAADRAAGAPALPGRVFGPARDDARNDLLRSLARRLAAAGREGLVVCGVNDPAFQSAVAWMNLRLGNTGSTVELDRPLSRDEDDRAMDRLISDMESGAAGVLMLHGVNPVYDHPRGAAFAAAMDRVPLVIAWARHEDETAACAGIVLPHAHPLEEWGDAEPVAGIVSVRQPAIAPFGDIRSLTECLHRWGGDDTGALESVRRAWKSSVFPRQSAEKDFEAFWNRTLHEGFAAVDPPAPARFDFDPPAAAGLVAAGAAAPGGAMADAAAGHGAAFDLDLRPTVGLLDGRHAHNPWLQELPDPVTKAVWDNYASISPLAAGRLGVTEGDVIRIESGEAALELPVLVQPGQSDGSITVPLGYGRKGTDRFTDIGPDWLEAVPTVSRGGTVGVNAFPLRRLSGGYVSARAAGVTIWPTGAHREVATTQVHQSLHVPEHLASAGAGRRPIVQETSLEAYRRSPAAGRFETGEIVSLWPDQQASSGHRWFMAIDLTACTGCSACVVGCQAENNIPVVGKDEVFRNREMTWLRVDRYYTEDAGGVSVAHQPMMCQHCAHAPCETVCPVLATVHSEEGLNQQVYNRCVGTRYCSNNCPYKVRRFNWFDYPRGDDMERLVLNPDVVVRERGIMEKCSLCVQRIQEGKIRAKAEGRPVADGDIRPACEQSCPAQAIVFGDLNDPASAVSAARRNPRFYRVLEEIGVEPAVGYLTLVRNLPEKGGDRG